MTSAVIPAEETRDTKRQAALLKAINLDRVPPEQREIALAIAKRYELDLLLKHLVLVDGRPYITRDGLLHVAHRSGQLDGIEVTDPELVTLPGVGEFWRARCSVYRKDMSRAFTYQGRYPAKGGNAKFAPEMAVKVAEVMALRRAFDVSAPVIEERWDIDVPTVQPEPPVSLQEQVQARKASISGSGAGLVTAPVGQGEVPGGSEPPHPADLAGARADISETSSTDPGNPTPAPIDPGPIGTILVEEGEMGRTETKSKPAQCSSISPYGDSSRCFLEAGHRNAHTSADATWLDS